jgi:SpoVK/Ycf46/Vps4 family AAA+-type ATPase
MAADRPAPLGYAELAAACRSVSCGRLGELATKVEPRYGWADLVLPTDRVTLLREVCDQVRHRTRVHDEWGFGSTVAHGTGLGVLFSGPPGTGKTMAAQVLAADVGLDLYRVDLSRVVSKYIGETEKNLSQIFDEARDGDAILFFDEADALFGRRSEVSDAHDRYANIETGYLLQRMEDHDGVVVLATNLRQNMDDAFLRRLRFLVDFPFPDEEHRRRIWQGHFPATAPLDPGVDCAHLAREFPVAGGSIKNIILNAAFLAAADGGTIRTEHLLAGTRREFDKVGKVWVGEGR